jgi:hypothetical protein
MLDATPGHVAQENLKMGKAYVSHDVTNFEFLYEPFYVARDVVPPHDERFMGYGYTRNTQVSSAGRMNSVAILQLISIRIPFLRIDRQQ